MATPTREPAVPAPRVPARIRDPKVFLLTGILVLAVFYTLYFARLVILPITIAVLLNFLLSPIVRVLKKRAKVPYVLSAAILIFVLIGTVGITVYRLAAPAAAWMSKGPGGLHRLETKLAELRLPMQRVSQTAERVRAMTNIGSDTTRKVQLDSGGLRSRLFGSTTAILAQGAVIFTLLFFLLARGDVFLAKLIKVLPRLRDKKLALSIALETEQSISAYLVTTAATKLGLGILTGLAMRAIGLPNPVLWGVVGGLLNFIPYLGGLIAVGLLGIAGLATFLSLGQALLPAIVYFLLINIESFAMPYILGKRLALNPVAVFISVVFWGWLWGIAGALLAVPIMATFKIFCDHIQGMSAMGEFLGE
jgi:predicted PurR-regulated permease PerM